MSEIYECELINRKKETPKKLIKRIIRENFKDQWDSVPHWLQEIFFESFMAVHEKFSQPKYRKRAVHYLEGFVQAKLLCVEKRTIELSTMDYFEVSDVVDGLHHVMRLYVDKKLGVKQQNPLYLLTNKIRRNIRFFKFSDSVEISLSRIFDRLENSIVDTHWNIHHGVYYAILVRIARHIDFTHA